MLPVLLRTLVLPFYVRNAGTFAVVIYFTFGFLRASDHEALIDAALDAPFLLALVFALWSLYALRTVSFVRGQLAQPEHLFLQTFRLIPNAKRWLLWLIVMTDLLAPIVGYGIWMLIRAVRGQSWWSFGVIVLMLLGLIVAGAGAMDYRLRHTRPESVRLPRLNLQLRYELFFPTYWLRQQPLSLLLTKAISCGLLLGVCRLYPTDDYDQRLLLIGLMFAIITHSQLGNQLADFEHKYLLFLENIPLSWAQRFGRYMLTYGLIWLPELLILLRNYPTDIRLDYVFWLWLTGWGGLLLLHSLAYPRRITPERWQTGVFGGFIIGLVTIMFGLPVGIWGLLGWSIALGYWYYARKNLKQPDSV